MYDIFTIKGEDSNVSVLIGDPEKRCTKQRKGKDRNVDEEKTFDRPGLGSVGGRIHPVYEHFSNGLRLKKLFCEQRLLEQQSDRCLLVHWRVNKNRLEKCAENWFVCLIQIEIHYRIFV